MKTDHHRNCPNCNKIIYHKSRNSLLRSINKKTLCGSCSTSKSKKGVKHTKEHVDKIVASRRKTVIKKDTYDNCLNLKNNPKCSGKKLYHSKECRSCSKFLNKKCICKNCCKEFNFKNNSKNIYCSWECYLNRPDARGENSFFFKNRNNKEWREKAKITMDNWSDEKKLLVKEKAKYNAILVNTSDKKKLRMSKIISEKISSGEFNPFSNHKNGYYLNKNTNNEERYDSIYELARMLQLDDLNLKWTKKHGIRIKYILKNSEHRYIPDFLVGTNIIEEIKPETMLLLEINVTKFKYANEYCENNNMIYKIITETELGIYINKAKEYHERNRNIDNR